jgi:hypothetical protein
LARPPEVALKGIRHIVADEVPCAAYQIRA